MATSPHTHPELYRSILLGGKASPGVVTISAFDRKEGWEIQQPRGFVGALMYHRGRDIASFSARFQLVDDDQLDLWEEYSRLIFSTVDGPRPKALSVYHPDVARLRITDVVLGQMGVFQHDDKGGANIEVKFLEYRARKRRPLTKADESKSTTVADPNAASKAELQQLLDQAKSL